MSLARDIADLASVTSRLDTVGGSSGALSNRNLIINGAQNVNQRGNQTGLTANAYGTDRFNFTVTGRDELVYNLAQNTDVPSGYGFANSLSFQATTAESAIAADEYFFISHRIEAQNLQHLAYGTSSAKKVTLSFWVKSSVTGTFCIGLYKADNTAQVHNKTYTINSASTWEQKTITFEANTLSGGAIDDDNGLGLYVTWHLAAGSNFDSGSSTSSGWANYSTTNWCEPSTTDAVITTTNATFLLTGVQLEVGDTATDFEHPRSYGDELARCQRYFTRFKRFGASGALCNLSYYTASSAYGTIHFPTEMRSNPSLASSSGTNDFRIYAKANGGESFNSVTGLQAHETKCMVIHCSSLSGTEGAAGWIECATTSATLDFSSEL